MNIESTKRKIISAFRSKFRKPWDHMITLCLSALIFSISSMVEAMSIFDAGKAYVFSPVRLSITLDSKPVEGLKVIRRWSWNEDKGEDYAFTDSEGLVELPEIRRRGVTQFFPAEFVAAQQIVVVVDGSEDRIWSFSKRSPDINSELEGTPLDLTCELKGDEKMYRDFGPALFTKCTWSDQ
ncbi:DUF6795 domain-containing protein [Microbulbifer taiwanensis]|nr:DUF6795 domain-containing protein [Microbulbifer taiwanensis]